MAFSVKTNKEIIKWCDKKHMKNQTIALCWEGGNDSGWCWIEVDGKRADLKGGIPDLLIDMMYEYLDYGSWAGEFSSQGEAVYDPEKKAFIGTDNYAEDDSESIDTDIILRIPSSVWFDTINLDIEGEKHNVKPAVNIEFRIRNGFETDAHKAMTLQLENELAESFEQAIYDGRTEIEDNVREYSGIFFHETYRRDQFKTVLVDGVEMLEYRIDSISLSINKCDPKDVYLMLQEDSEEETDSSLELNDDSND